MHRIVRLSLESTKLVKQCNAAIARGEDAPLGFGIDTWMLIVIIIGTVAVVVVVAVVFLKKKKVQPAPSQ